jgi:hypothetical protein
MPPDARIGAFGREIDSQSVCLAESGTRLRNGINSCFSGNTIRTRRDILRWLAGGTQLFLGHASGGQKSFLVLFPKVLAALRQHLVPSRGVQFLAATLLAFQGCGFRLHLGHLSSRPERAPYPERTRRARGAEGSWLPISRPHRSMSFTVPTPCPLCSDLLGHSCLHSNAASRRQAPAITRETSSNPLEPAKSFLSHTYTSRSRTALIHRNMRHLGAESPITVNLQ